MQFQYKKEMEGKEERSASLPGGGRYAAVGTENTAQQIHKTSYSAILQKPPNRPREKPPQPPRTSQDRIAGTITKNPQRAPRKTEQKKTVPPSSKRKHQPIQLWDLISQQVASIFSYQGSLTSFV